MSVFGKHSLMSCSTITLLVALSISFHISFNLFGKHLSNCCQQIFFYTFFFFLFCCKFCAVDRLICCFCAFPHRLHFSHCSNWLFCSLLRLPRVHNANLTNFVNESHKIAKCAINMSRLLLQLFAEMAKREGRVASWAGVV